VETAASGVQRSIGENPVHPAFENGRHAEPPKRKLQQNEVGPEKIVNLLSHIGRQCFPFGTEALLGLHVEPRWIFPLREMPGMFVCGKLLCIKIADPHRMALRQKHLGRRARQRAIEGLRLRMSQDDQHIHAVALYAGHGQTSLLATGKIRIADGSGMDLGLQVPLVNYAPFGTCRSWQKRKNLATYTILPVRRAMRSN
jgi:hypothetical protein